MINEVVYVAVDKDDKVQWIKGSSSKTKYFATDRHVTRAVEYHNQYHADDIWRVVRCELKEG